MSKIRVSAGIATIEISDSLGRYIHHVLDNVAPGIRQRLGKAVNDLESYAVDNWPVGSDKDGHSIDKFETGLRLVSATKIEAYILNKAPYAYMIKSEKGLLKGGKNAWSELVRKPGLKKQTLLVEQLTGDLIKLAGK